MSHRQLHRKYAMVEQDLASATAAIASRDARIRALQASTAGTGACAASACFAHSFIHSDSQPWSFANYTRPWQSKPACWRSCVEARQRVLRAPARWRPQCHKTAPSMERRESAPDAYRHSLPHHPSTRTSACRQAGTTLQSKRRPASAVLSCAPCEGALLVVSGMAAWTKPMTATVAALKMAQRTCC